MSGTNDGFIEAAFERSHHIGVARLPKTTFLKNNEVDRPGRFGIARVLLQESTLTRYTAKKSL